MLKEKKKDVRTMNKKWVYRASILAMIGNLLLPAFASAAQLTSRKLTLSNSAASATGVTYTFNFTVPAGDIGTVVKSVNVDICTTASGACTPSGTGVPAGLSTTSATFTQPTGLGDASGWTSVVTTNGRLRFTKTANATAPSGSQSFAYGAITNPSATNTTFFARITTYSDDNYTTAVSTGTVVASTANAINVTASVDETLTFCVYTGANCGAGGSTVALGSLSSATTGTGTSKMDVATNGSGGYNVTYTGTTLTGPGATTIPAMGTQSANGAATTSAVGTSQFGINLRDNATPDIGADVSGTGSGTYGTNYGTADSFRHFTGDSIATAAGATNSNTFTASYIANISGSQAAGAYTTTLTYICTATY